jgi:hypothetical protein
LSTLKDDLGHRERVRKVSYRSGNDLGEASRFASVG